MNKITFLIISAVIMALSCMRYLTNDRGEVLLDDIDLDQTLKVATMEMKLQNGSFGTSLPLWVIRDQYFDPIQTNIVKNLYLEYIDKLEKNFDVWHLTWAISNIYRLGDDSVKMVLEDIIGDVRERSLTAGKISIKMSDQNEKIFMGDAHGGGRGYAKKHIVVPGNEKYLQSFEDYLSKKKRRKRE